MHITNLKKDLFVIPAAIAFFASALAAQPSLTPYYNFQTVDYPGSIATYPLGINDLRTVVGYYLDPTFAAHGFLWKNGVFTTIDHPNAKLGLFAGTTTGGINDLGVIAGTYLSKTDGFLHGFRLNFPAGCDADDKNCAPVFTELDVPGAAQIPSIPFEFGPGLGTASIGINLEGSIVGMYATAGLFSNGFVLKNGVYLPVTNPLAGTTPGAGSKCFAINDLGAMACDYIVQASPQSPPHTHGFLVEGTKITPIEVPGSESGLFGTQINGVNDFRQVVGSFLNGLTLEAMVWIGGNYYTLNYPGQPNYNELHSINNLGVITGAYATDPAGHNVHGFLAIPKL